MKNFNILTVGVLAGAVALTGCKDSFLDVESYTEDFVETYYTTEEHLEQSIIAAYSPLEWNDWNGVQYNPQNVMSDIMGDDIWPGGASKNDNQFWHLMMNYEAIPTNCMTGIWSNMYSGVKRSNDLIKYCNDQRSELSDARYNVLTAQARVLRAYYYNMLWKFWGNIPYFEENLSAPFHAPQLSADEVYANVVTDLEEVIALNALPMYWDDNELGRVSQAMTYMLYAEMVMYQNDESRYAKALDFMKAIINDSHYGLHADYSEMFEASGEWCKESIFEVNYTDDHSVRGWGTGDAIIAGGTVLPRLASVPGGVPELGIDDGWGFCPVRTECYNMFEENDARRAVSALDLRSYTDGRDGLRYQNTGFWCGKFTAYSKNVERATGDKQLNYNNNLRVYRFAETLLNAAELALRAGDSASARNWLNQVRQRAGLEAAEATLDNIIEERHLEFVGEGKRYWDLVRTGKAATVLVPDAYGYRTNSWSETRKYQPIPYTEMAADPNLVQNPGY